MHAVTVVIPAYNEAARIAGVLQAIKGASLVNEIIVVDDGSHDGTTDIAATAGVRVCRLMENQGKGTAMRTGALQATGDILLFLDADLHGLTPGHVDALITPLLAGTAEMSMGIFRGGRAATDLAQRISPNLSGQRCLYRDFFLSAPLVDGSRSGVEIALTIHASACKITTVAVPLDAVTHPVKEEKLGLLQGILARARMYSDICSTLLRYHLITRFAGRAPMANK